MKTLELIDRDLNLSNHSFVMLDDRATAKQRIFNRLLLYLGEFSLEPSIGMDWFSIRENKLPKEQIEKSIRSELLKDSEVTGIESIEVILIDTTEKANFYQKELRTAIIKLFVNTIYGDLRLNV
jgi:hypothetical protein